MCGYARLLHGCICTGCTRGLTERDPCAGVEGGSTWSGEWTSVVSSPPRPLLLVPPCRELRLCSVATVVCVPSSSDVHARVALPRCATPRYAALARAVGEDGCDDDDGGGDDVEGHRPVKAHVVDACGEDDGDREGEVLGDRVHVADDQPDQDTA